MTRPRPTINSPNDYDAYFRQAQEFTRRFAACDGVVGVLLTGGVTRGYADHFSELDLAVYLTRPHFEDWTRRGLAPFPEGDSRLDGWHVDFDYFCYEDEMEAEWEHTKRWDRSYAVVLYDPQRLMQEMLARKAVLTEEEKQRLTTHHLILYGEYFCNLVIPSWLHRGDPLAAHHCLNTALDSLIRAVFLANDELIPFDKWTLNLSYTLPWTPQDWRERVEQAVLVREVSRAEVKRRCGLIRDLFAECREELIGPKAEGLDIIEARKLKILRHVRERGAMPATEFDQRFGLRRAIQSPLFHLLRREMREGQPNIIAIAWLIPVSVHPPLVGMSIGPTRHSYGLIQASGEFVVNVAPHEIAQQVLFCGRRSGRDVDKFAATGLTAGKARHVRPPIIEECIAHLECRVVQELEAGDHHLVIGEVLAVYTQSGVLDDNGLYDLSRVHPLLHLGRNRFTSTLGQSIEPPLSEREAKP